MASTRVRGKSKRIYVLFRYEGRQLHEPTPYLCERIGKRDCKCRSCKSALSLAMEIDRKIKEGNFDLKTYFPKSSALKRLDGVNVDDDVTFSKYIIQWLDFKKSVIAYSTHNGYKSQVYRLIPLFNNMLLNAIRPAHIRNIVKMFVDNSISPKTIKNIIFMLNCVFEEAKEDHLITENPCANVILPKVIKHQPDPFTLNEVHAILKEIEKRDPHLVAFYAIGFYAGLRTGEILALEWGDIDFIAKKIVVSKTCTHGKLKQGTKTGRIIKVDIIEPLEYYLSLQKQYTLLKGSSLFLIRDKAVISYNTIIKHFKPALLKLGIRYRQPYQMRHTFAVMMLSAGEDPNWIKSQLGHTSLEMLFNTYGNWYNPDTKFRAGTKFCKMLATG